MLRCCHSTEKIHHCKTCVFSLDKLKHSFWQPFFAIKVKAQAALKAIMQKLYKETKIPKWRYDSTWSDKEARMTWFLLTRFHHKRWISSLERNTQYKRNVTKNYAYRFSSFLFHLFSLPLPTCVKKTNIFILINVYLYVY